MSSKSPTNGPAIRLAAILFSAALVCMATALQAAGPVSSDVFVSGTDGYAGYRIPAIEVTPNGTLVAFAEARKYNLADPGFGKQDIDLVYKTSSDGGTSVSPVACAVERYSLATAGHDRNRILWTGPKGPKRNNLVLRISYDEGKTFGDERSIAKEPAAYSDMSILKDRSVGVLWERANYKYITFTRLDREFVEGNTKP